MKNSTTLSSAAGIVSASATGGSLIGYTVALTGPAANLGGYATAQVVASSLPLVSGGPALSLAVAALGGPATAGVLLCVGVGATVYGGCKLINKLFN